MDWQVLLLHKCGRHEVASLKCYMLHQLVKDGCVYRWYCFSYLAISRYLNCTSLQKLVATKTG